RADAGEDIEDGLSREARGAAELDLPQEHRADANRRVMHGVGGGAYTRSPRDPEPALADRRLLERFQPGDGGSPGARATPRNQLVDGCRGALEDRLDAPIVAVADPPRHPPPLGRPSTSGSEEHALDVPRDDHVHTSHPTMLPRGRSIAPPEDPCRSTTNEQRS